MATQVDKDHWQQFSCEVSIKDLEDGKMLDGDSGASFSPPDDFDMDKFNRGRHFFRDNLFICSVLMFFSLIIGMITPELLEAVVFTSQSDTPDKAFKRFSETSYYISLWHYGNIWDKDSKAHKSICRVRQMHRIVRENMQKADASRTNKFISQFDMGVVLSGFMGSFVLYNKAIGIGASTDVLDDYVYFWYGVGHMLGIQKKYNICAHGLSHAFTFCKSIEQNIINENEKHPPRQYKQVAETIIQGYQRTLTPGNLFTLPVMTALSKEYRNTGHVETLSFSDTIRYLILKLIYFTAIYVPWFKRFMNHRIEKKCRLTFTEM